MRSRTNPIDEIWGVLVRVHWSVGVILAAAAFLLLHWLAGMSAGHPKAVEELGAFTVRSFIFTGARLGQYVLPPVLLFGALLSLLFRRRARRAPGDAAADSRDPDSSLSQPTPKCPDCGAQMVRRVARQGSKAGQSFWGCTNYPRCHGIVS
jgi:hypothetical protein